MGYCRSSNNTCVQFHTEFLGNNNCQSYSCQLLNVAVFTECCLETFIPPVHPWVIAATELPRYKTVSKQLKKIKLEKQQGMRVSFGKRVLKWAATPLILSEGCILGILPVLCLYLHRSLSTYATMHTDLIFVELSWKGEYISNEHLYLVSVLYILFHPCFLFIHLWPRSVCWSWLGWSCFSSQQLVWGCVLGLCWIHGW